MKVCPNDSTHDTFITTGIEYHDWLVDGKGDFLDDKGIYEGRLGQSDFECATCHAIAVESQDA